MTDGNDSMVDVSQEVQQIADMADQVSLSWVDEEITRKLPWDETQFVTVKQLTGKEKRKRGSIGTRMSMRKGSADMDIQLALDEVRDYEYSHCIIDYSLKVQQPNGQVRVINYDPKINKKVYDSISGRLETFIDGLIAEVNKETELGKKEIEEVEGN